jgi:nitrate reductase gamma subunit
MGQAVLTAWVWLAAVVFVAGCGWRAWRYAKAPVHLRWDLYPVAHEPRGRRAYGGSHLEEREYWLKPHRRSVAGEVVVTLEEIAFLRGVWRNNRRIFWASLPFHWGLYLLLVTSGLLLLAAIGVEPAWLLRAAGGAALAGGVLLAAGGVRLLILRTIDPALRRYSAPADRLNLAAFATLGALSAAVALGPHGMQPAASAVASTLRFEPAAATTLVAAHMLLAGLILAYLPFTRMVHFFAKYFLYHQVRWDDRPVIPGGSLEKGLRAAMDFGVSWSADHVGPGRTWKDVAAGAPPGRRKP